MTCPPHRYRIAEPDGSPMLPATCQHCGHSRMFGASDEAVAEMANRPYTWDGAMTVKSRRHRPDGDDVRTCEVCGRVFASVPGRISHERNCAAGKLKCPLCGGEKVTATSKRCRQCAARENVVRHNQARKEMAS